MALTRYHPVPILSREVVAKEYFQVPDRSKEEIVHRVLGDPPIAELCTIEFAFHLGMDPFYSWTNRSVGSLGLLSLPTLTLSPAIGMIRTKGHYSSAFRTGTAIP